MNNWVIRKMNRSYKILYYLALGFKKWEEQKRVIRTAKVNHAHLFEYDLANMRECTSNKFIGGYL